MSKKITRKQALRRRRIFILCCTLALTAVVGLLAFAGVQIAKIATGGSASSSSGGEVSSDVSEPEQVHKIAEATVVNTGDILVHNPVLAGAQTASGGYDFSDFFPAAQSYFKAADLAVINLEVTLGGTESGAYKGYPAFNTPDSLIDTLGSAGIGLCLTANNHSYDTGLFGMKRTVQVLKQKGMTYLGTRETTDEPRYLIQEINGIKIGMVCYTYENTCDTPGRKSLNGNILKEEANDLINSFAYERIEEFYADAAAVISGMRSAGADCVVFYMHWGQEYQLSPNQWQKSIAQRLCDLGVDVIVGGHPHVLQPLELIHASGSEHTAVCLYSMGNSISNQRIEEMTGVCTSGHTEDGVLFSYTFEKYSDGTTVLSAVDAVPTWVNKVGSRYSAKYTMYPIENPSDGSAKYGLDSTTAAKLTRSYERTRALIGESLTACQTALGCSVRFSEMQAAS